MNTKDNVGLDQLRRVIRDAYPAVQFEKAITPADDETNEDFSDERAIRATLHGRRWTEVQPSFVVTFAYALPLLTNDAFISFLPAWLDTSLINSEVREALIHTFAKQVDAEASSFMSERVGRLSTSQMQALAEVLAHAIEVEAGTRIEGEARLALDFVMALSQA